MSGTTRTPLGQAMKIAQEAYDALTPFCTRIEIAGSLRRQQQDIGDIEMVAIPRLLPAGLFADEWTRDPGFITSVNQWEHRQGDATAGKAMKRILPSGLVLDLYTASPETWGSILLIRTGDWEFSKHVMGTLLPRHGYRHKDGYVWKRDVIVPVPEEHDLFRLVGKDVIAPSQRVGPIL